MRETNPNGMGNDVNDRIHAAWELVRSSAKLYSKGLETGINAGKGLEGEEIERLIFLGMGGSGIVGDIIRDMLAAPYTIPVHIFKDYSIPIKPRKDDLVIAVSYSGGTTETLTAFAQAHEAGCKLAAITSGGDLAKLAEKKGIPLATVSSGLQPRYAAPEMVSAAYGLLTHITQTRTEAKIMRDAIEELREYIEQFKKVNEGEAYEYAKSINNKIAVIYGHTHLFSTAYRLKAQLNENAKSQAFLAQLPEACHNEVEGWLMKTETAHIFLRSGYEPPIITSMVKWMTETLLSRGYTVKELRTEAKSHVAEIMKLVALIDFISISLAALRGADPLTLHLLPEVRKALQLNERLRQYALSSFAK